MIPQFKELISLAHLGRNVLAEVQSKSTDFDAAMAALDAKSAAPIKVDAIIPGVVSGIAQVAPSHVSPPERLLPDTTVPAALVFDGDLTPQVDTGAIASAIDAPVMSVEAKAAELAYGTAEDLAVSVLLIPVRAEYAAQFVKIAEPIPAIAVVQPTAKTETVMKLSRDAKEDSPKLVPHSLQPHASARVEKRQSRLDVAQTAPVDPAIPRAFGEKPAEEVAQASPNAPPSSGAVLVERAIQFAAAQLEYVPMSVFAPNTPMPILQPEPSTAVGKMLNRAVGENSGMARVTAAQTTAMAGSVEALMAVVKTFEYSADVQDLAETPKGITSSLESALTLRIGDQSIKPAVVVLAAAVPDAKKTDESNNPASVRHGSLGQPIETMNRDASVTKTTDVTLAEVTGFDVAMPSNPVSDGVNVPNAIPQMTQPPERTSAPKEPTVAGQTAAPKIPAMVSGQLVHHSAAAKNGGVEVLLAPAELGHVKFQIHQQADSVRLVISAERSDTLDLLRRNSEQLLQEFKQAGFSGASLSFGDWNQRGKSSNMPAQTALAFDEDFVVAAPLPRGQSTATTSSTGQGLDLRL